ncbi:MAG: cytochrome c-type biogenesis protein CcmH, partial [Zoogloeaceae bacterium]|nr:cytochrome c-type biogenesis protein CcmH [Zoogloeaceae bacterium]
MKSFSLVRLFAALALLAASPLLFATEEAKPLADDPVAEKRLIAISSELRCLVCQNETIAASNADLAQDLRREIRTQIQAGQSDDEIINFMVNRYGDFVLYRPRFIPKNLPLWTGPLLFLLIGAALFIRYLKQRNQKLQTAVPLSAAERQ